MSEQSPVRCDDPSTWRHKGEKIDLPRLLQLIEENGGPEGLDLHGADLSNIDARPEALQPYLQAYAQKHGADAWAPWITGYASLLPSKPTDGGVIGLWGAHLEKARLNTAQMEGANLATAHLEEAYLFDADLQNANLSSAHLQNAKLSAAHLQNANLVGARLQNARLIATHLQNARLLAAHLEDADLSGAHLNGAFLQLASLNRTRFARPCLGTAIGEELAARGHAPHPNTFYWAKETYLALKTNFDSIGRYADASWAYVKEQQMEKAMHFPTEEGHYWIWERIGSAVAPPWWGPGQLPRWLWWKLRSAFYHTRLFLGLCPRQLRQSMARRDERGEERDEWLSRWRWARNWAFEVLAGYGERVYMPVIWAGVVIALFAVIYAAAGNIAAGDVGALQGQPTHSPITALVHSISAFATIGFNTLEPQGWGARLLTALEAMFGIGLFALFVFTLGNRMRRS